LLDGGAIVLKRFEAEAALANCRALINQINAGLSAEEPFVNVSSTAELQLYIGIAATASYARAPQSVCGKHVTERNYFSLASDDMRRRQAAGLVAISIWTAGRAIPKRRDDDPQKGAPGSCRPE
jgi:hypothetical protein